MSGPSDSTSRLRYWLERLQAGDPAARAQLIRYSCERLQRLSRQMLKGFPGVKRWEQTDDVFQGAMVRLLRALEDVRPESVRHFLALAATQIRRELLDLARHYYGPEGPGGHHESRAGNDRDSGLSPAYEQGVATHEPGRLAAWCEFHEQIARLPDEEREVFELLWYHGLTQAEAAALLNVSERTVKRRWQSARLKMPWSATAPLSRTPGVGVQSSPA